MTRINVIPPKELCRQHLIAEYRELPRVFTLAANAFSRGESPKDPRNPLKYTLGKGHVRFFYNKLTFLDKRFNELVSEMISRNYTTNFTSSFLENNNLFTADWLCDYVPTEEAIKINRDRIEQRLSTMKK